MSAVRPPSLLLRVAALRSVRAAPAAEVLLFPRDSDAEKAGFPFGGDDDAATLLTRRVLGLFAVVEQLRRARPRDRRAVRAGHVP